jgi:uncharacterized OB-fold protein
MLGLEPGPGPGEVMVPSCQSCGRAHWYPKPTCPSCGGEWTWKAVDGRGTIFTFSVVRRAFSPELADRLPIPVGTVALDLAPEVRLITNFVNCPPEDLRVGLAVAPVLEDGPDETRRMNYAPIPSPDSMARKE